MRFDFIKCELFSDDFETWKESPSRQFSETVFCLVCRWFKDTLMAGVCVGGAP